MSAYSSMGAAPQGSRLIEGFIAAGVDTVVALPDIWTSTGLLFPISRDHRLNLLRVCKEDEAIGICAGIWLGGRRAVAMMQHTGFLDSVNAIRGVIIEGPMPVCMVVGLLHKEQGVPARDSRNTGIRAVPQIAAALGLLVLEVETNEHLDGIDQRIRDVFEKRQPLAILFGARPQE